MVLFKLFLIVMRFLLGLDQLVLEDSSRPRRAFVRSRPKAVSKDSSVAAQQDASSPNLRYGGCATCSGRTGSRTGSTQTLFRSSRAGRQPCGNAQHTSPAGTRRDLHVLTERHCRRCVPSSGKQGRHALRPACPKPTYPPRRTFMVYVGTTCAAVDKSAACMF